MEEKKEKGGVEGYLRFSDLSHLAEINVLNESCLVYGISDKKTVEVEGIFVYEDFVYRHVGEDKEAKVEDLRYFLCDETFFVTNALKQRNLFKGLLSAEEIKEVRKISMKTKQKFYRKIEVLKTIIKEDPVYAE